jgi:predicted DNA binding CopG/RHH family protein
LQSADLSEYDRSGMKKVRFELARIDASISLHLPAALPATLRANAARARPTQRLIRMMIEAQLAETGAGPKQKRKQQRKTRAPVRGRGSDEARLSAVQSVSKSQRPST